MSVRAAEVEVHRDVVMGVDPGGHDNLEVGPVGDALDAQDVPAQADDGGSTMVSHPAALSALSLSTACCSRTVSSPQPSG